MNDNEKREDMFAGENEGGEENNTGFVILEEASSQREADNSTPMGDTQPAEAQQAPASSQDSIHSAEGDAPQGVYENASFVKPQNYQEQTSHTRYASYEFSSKGEPKKEKPKKKKKGIFKSAVKFAAAGVLVGVAAYGSIAVLTKLTGPLVIEKEITPIATTTTVSGKDEVKATTAATSGTVVYDVSQVTQSVMPSVVAISSKGTTQISSFWGTQSQPFESSGSGVIVGSNDEELLIATNNHVIADADTVEITFDDKTTAAATLKGKSSEMDLAVVAVKLSDLSEDTIDHIKIATLGDSSELLVGEPAIAIGNALGYGQSVTFGVISALDREVTVQTDSTYGFGNSETVTSKLIQTDAAINPGNSGGALFNIRGEVIGINSVKYASEEVEGMGYAIPITEAQPILDELMNRKTKEVVDESERAYLGIRGADVTSEAQSVYGMPKGGFVVSVEEDSAAEKAGVVKGDVIVKFGDTTVGSMEELQEELQYYKAGETVEVIVARSEAGEYVEKTLTVELDKKPEKQ